MPAPVWQPSAFDAKKGVATNLRASHISVMEKLSGMPVEASVTNAPARLVSRAVWRGMRLRCPHCGEGRMFRAYLKVNDHCPVCGEDLSHHRADDAPP